MSLATKIYDVRVRFSRIENVFRYLDLTAPILAMILAYLLDKSFWSIIGYGISSFIIFVMADFLLCGMIITPIFDKKIRSLLEQQITESGFSSDIKGYWNFRMFSADVQ